MNRNHYLLHTTSKILVLLFIILFTSIYTTTAQQTITGHIKDEVTHESLPFATIKLGNSKQGLISDLNGYFQVSVGKEISYLEIGYLGYNSNKIKLPATQTDMTIYLSPKGSSLNEVVITPPYEKMRYIINRTIANRDRHNPDKYSWYQCHIYYKMIADLKMSDSVLAATKDTSLNSVAFANFLHSQHILMSETYSIRTWESPQKLQEQVLGSRLSGFKKSMFTSLVTDILPFHAYTDFISLNGKEYPNPISKGYGQRYNFNLVDEIIQGSDTVWILSFRPKNNYNDLSGTVYINSNEFAIQHIIARSKDEVLKKTVSIEQQYKQIDGRWFPDQLNYSIDLQQQTKDSLPYSIHLDGHSTIDSVTFQENSSFHFDKAHTVKLEGHADELSDTAWRMLRPFRIDAKETRTYEYMDSLIAAIKFDRLMPLLSKLPEGKLPIGSLDVDLKRLYGYNEYEGHTLGLGLQTNEKIMPRLSIGGWGRYGFSDTKWKYGAFAEWYMDRYKEGTIRIAYDNDVHEPGRLQITRELDKNPIRTFIVSRVDHVEAFSVDIKKKMGYWVPELSFSQEVITPNYNYALSADGKNYTSFNTNEVAIGTRYQFAERTAPVMGKYVSLGSAYPIVYARATQGVLNNHSLQINYTQLQAAISWKTHINRIGVENFLLQGGASYSDKTLPLSKLFAGNGMSFKNSYFGYYGFGYIMTALPYQFYSDRFVIASWKHDFDWRLYSVHFFKNNYNSSPFFSIAHNVLYGTLQHPELQQLVSFSVPDNAYHESGVMLNSLLRIRYFNVAYLTLGAGFFYHWTPTFDADRNGRFIISSNFEL
jgi:hypothetical protein